MWIAIETVHTNWLQEYVDMWFSEELLRKGHKLATNRNDCVCVTLLEEGAPERLG